MLRVEIKRGDIVEFEIDLEIKIGIVRDLDGCFILVSYFNLLQWSTVWIKHEQITRI